jgi:hypothetical protein
MLSHAAPPRLEPQRPGLLTRFQQLTTRPITSAGVNSFAMQRNRGWQRPLYGHQENPHLRFQPQI